MHPIVEASQEDIDNIDSMNSYFEADMATPFIHFTGYMERIAMFVVALFTGFTCWSMWQILLLIVDKEDL